MARILARLLLALGALFSANVLATAHGSPPSGLEVLPLAGITNDRDAGLSRLALIVDARDAVRAIAVETRHAAGDGADKITRRVYPLRRIESRRGVVLGRGRGVEAILLRGRIDSRTGRGVLVIRYLANGLLMNYHECRIGLDRAGRRGWRLVNAYNGRAIHMIRVKTWMLGIATLENVCPGAGRD